MRTRMLPIPSSSRAPRVGAHGANGAPGGRTPGAPPRTQYPAATIIRTREWLALGLILGVVIGIPVLLVIEAIRRWA